MPVEIGLESVNGRVDMKVTAFTTDKVTGNMQVVDWSKYAGRWSHLDGISFPKLGSKPIIDILIGMDYADLHYSYRDIRGRPGEPIARLTPLGWTCIGNTVCSNVDKMQHQTNFAHTYFVKHSSELAEINNTLRQFWEIEDIPDISEIPVLSRDDQIALHKVQNSLTFVDGRYQVATPWREDVPELPNNYDMAKQRLLNTEKKLLKNEDIGKAYVENIRQYVNKGYVHKIPEAEENQSKWYLPHFAVVRPDRTTTKTRIVYDASAKYEDIALNDIIHQGPKLQRDLFDVLLRFRKNPVALVSDISEMYLNIQIAPEDRPYFRFLWRELQTDKPPDVYEFKRVVFGATVHRFKLSLSLKHMQKPMQLNFLWQQKLC
ncbi:uncharacterized protein [Ptychodera flava]|uniref:uncharacterized protein n=1 Tax=Ptychodera flava TaxID=63121 RepID=UPI00396A1BBF